MQLAEINLRDPFVLNHKGLYYLYGTRGATSPRPAILFAAVFTAENSCRAVCVAFDTDSALLAAIGSAQAHSTREIATFILLAMPLSIAYL